MRTTGISRRQFTSVAVSATALGAIGVGPARARQAVINPENYSSLSIEALGHLNHFHNLSRQIPGDWSGMGIVSVDQEGDDGLHMQLPYMSYAVAVSQYLHTPAYRELNRGTLGNLIEKMRRNEVWDYWGRQVDGAGPRYSADPINVANVEYSGHLLPMMAMYEMFYRDGRWDKPGSFTLRHISPVKGYEEFVYDLPKIAEVTLKQFRESGYLGLECEPDEIFPTTCNIFPMHGFIHLDYMRGTKFADEVIPAHIKAWQQISPLYRVDAQGPVPFGIFEKGTVLGLSDSGAFGKFQFMNVHVREWVQSKYPVWRDRFFGIDDNGMLVPKTFEDGGRTNLQGERLPARASAASQLPQELRGSNEQPPHRLAAIAGEMGDTRFVEAALRYANHHNPPVWDKGALYYERNDELGTPRYTNRRGAILIASGKMWEKDAYSRLYHRPWGKAELEAPEVQDIDYPRVLVSQAVHDASADALIVSILPHGILPDSRQPTELSTSFSVIRLSPATTYQITRDGKSIGKLEKGQLSDLVSDAGLSMEKGALKIATHLRSAPQTFIVSAL